MISPDYLGGMKRVDEGMPQDSKIELYYDPDTAFMVYIFLTDWTLTELSEVFRITRPFIEDERITNTFADFDQGKTVPNVMSARSQLQKNSEKRGYLPLYIKGESPVLRTFISIIKVAMPSLTIKLIASYEEALKDAGKLSDAPNQSPDESLNQLPDSE